MLFNPVKLLIYFFDLNSWFNFPVRNFEYVSYENKQQPIQISLTSHLRMLNRGDPRSPIFFRKKFGDIGRFRQYWDQGSAHLKFFLDRIGIGSVALNFLGRIGRLKFFLDQIGIESVASKFFWIGSGSNRSAQNFLGSDRIGWLKKKLNQIGIGSVFMKSRFPHIVNRENIF